MPASSVSYSATRTVSVVPLIPPLHYVERGTLKDSFTVAGGDDPSSQQWEPTVPSRVAAKAAARLVPLKRPCCARLRAKAEGTGGEVDSAARRTTHSSGDSLTLAILWLRARTPNP